MTQDHAARMRADARMATLRARRERFERIVKLRMDRLLRELTMLRRCSARASYAYGPTDVELIFGRLDAEVQATRKVFEPPQPTPSTPTFDFPKGDASAEPAARA